MGGAESKGHHHGDDSHHHNKASGNSKSRPTLAPEVPPYLGPGAQYHFINCEVMLGTHLSMISIPMMTSNIDTYYPMLAAQYAEGYRLLSFYQMPGQIQQNPVFSQQVPCGFQGIFCRYPSVPRRESWQLRVEKSMIQRHQNYTGIVSFSTHPSTVTDASHLLESITRNSEDGGRLVCMEMTGQRQQGGLGMAQQGVSPLLGVDLFFEIPEAPSPQRYMYNCVSVPYTVTVAPSSGFKSNVHCDWLGHLASHLKQGWRLVEIFMDKNIFSQIFKHAVVTPITIDTSWFFEKPASCMSDPRPVYEGAVIDHHVKVKGGSRGVRTTANWEPVIQEMGNRGWELACILETPQMQATGLATVYMTCKMFFQRPILPRNDTLMPSAPPPPYDLVVGGVGEGGEGQGDVAAPSPPPPGFSVPPSPPLPPSAPEKTGW
ncbi:uncharacterized protein LOC143298857 [Babylonia areolata]|uniref:uncharacterized protein LOC143298857 n=1 Tax=Babylonia areolata TaxID=304850 RepID=UPI003FD6466F